MSGNVADAQLAQPGLGLAEHVKGLGRRGRFGRRFGVSDFGRLRSGKAAGNVLGALFGLVADVARKDDARVSANDWKLDNVLGLFDGLVDRAHLAFADGTLAVLELLGLQGQAVDRAPQLGADDEPVGVAHVHGLGLAVAAGIVDFEVLGVLVQLSVGNDDGLAGLVALVKDRRVRRIKGLGVKVSELVDKVARERGLGVAGRHFASCFRSGGCSGGSGSRCGGSELGRLLGNHSQNIKLVLVEGFGAGACGGVLGYAHDGGFGGHDLGPLGANSVQVGIVGVQQNVSEDVNVPRDPPNVGRVRHKNIRGGNLKGGQVHSSASCAIGNVGGLFDLGAHAGQKGCAFEARQLGQLLTDIVGRRVLVLVEHLKHSRLVLGQPCVALVRPEQAKDEAVVVRDFVDAAEAVEAAKVGLLELLAILEHGRNVLKVPAVVLVVRGGEELHEAVDGEHKLFELGPQIIELGAAGGAGAGQGDLDGVDGDAVVRVPAGPSVHQKSGAVLDWAGGCPPVIPGADVEKRHLGGRVGEELVARLLLTAGKEGNDGSRFGDGRAVKDLLKAVADRVSKVRVDHGQLPPGLHDRGGFGLGNRHFGNGLDELHLPGDAAYDVLGHDGGAAAAEAGKVAGLDLRRKVVDERNDLELDDLVGVVRLEHGLDVDRDLGGGRQVLGGHHRVHRKDPGLLFGHA